VCSHITPLTVFCVFTDCSTETKLGTSRTNSIPRSDTRHQEPYRWPMLASPTQTDLRYTHFVLYSLAMLCPVSTLVQHHHLFSLQFLITVGSNLESLDDRNTVFGFVAEGMDVVQKINEAFVDKDGVRARLCISPPLMKGRNAKSMVFPSHPSTGPVSNHSHSPYAYPGRPIPRPSRSTRPRS
jgi:hypothetical protein